MLLQPINGPVTGVITGSTAKIRAWTKHFFTREEIVEFVELLVFHNHCNHLFLITHQTHCRSAQHVVCICSLVTTRVGQAVLHRSPPHNIRGSMTNRHDYQGAVWSLLP